MKSKPLNHDNCSKTAVRFLRSPDHGTARFSRRTRVMEARILVNVLLVLLSSVMVNSSMGCEPERKEKVLSLIKNLADESPGKRQATYLELRDGFLRKRDIPELAQEIARNSNPEVSKSLQELVTYIQEGRWRLPDKACTADLDAIISGYEKEFENLGVDVSIVTLLAHRPKQILELEIWEEGLIPAEKKIRIINLILTLEPESLGLRWGDWSDINFVGSLTNLEEFSIEKTLVSNLTPLKGNPSLNNLTIKNSEHITDLSPLKDLPKLTHLVLNGIKVRDLTPLKDLKLSRIELRGTQVTDLTPLKAIPGLYIVTEDGVKKNE